MIFVLILLTLPLSAIGCCDNITFLTNLLADRRDDLHFATKVYFIEDHTGYGPNQDPSKWVRFRFIIDTNSTIYQLTAAPLAGNKGAYWAAFNSVGIIYNTPSLFEISLRWWDKPWTLYVLRN